MGTDSRSRSATFLSGDGNGNGNFYAAIEHTTPAWDDSTTHARDGTRVAEIVKESGVDRKAALKQAARERGLTRREAYKQLLVTRDE